MPVYEKTFVGIPGLYEVSDPSMAYSTILMVSRSGAVHKQTAGEPGNQEFGYELANGRIFFESTNVFEAYYDPSLPDDTTGQFERIHVIYKQ